MEGKSGEKEKQNSLDHDKKSLTEQYKEILWHISDLLPKEEGRERVQKHQERKQKASPHSGVQGPHPLPCPDLPLSGGHDFGMLWNMDWLFQLAVLAMSPLSFL